MKIRKDVRKLNLSRETLHALRDGELRTAAGGISDPNAAFGNGSGCQWSAGSHWFGGGFGLTNCYT